MIRLFKSFMCAWLLAIGGAALADAPHSYTVYRLPQAPKLDGVVQGDAAWAAVPMATGFYRLGGDYTVDKQTTVQVGWDHAALYFGMVCEEPDIADAAPIQKDGGDVWTDDSVEIFIQLPGQLGVFQLVVNTAGARTVGEGGLSLALWQAGAHRGADSWSVEVRVPFSALGRAPQAGETWRGTCCRNIFLTKSGGDKFTSWSPLQGRFREPENFAAWVLSREALSAAQAKAKSRALNAAYRARLVAELKRLAADAAKCRPAVAQCVAKGYFGPEAKTVQGQWAEVERLSAGVDDANLRSVRRVLQYASALRAKSFELKYRMLLEDLISD